MNVPFLDLRAAVAELRPQIDEAIARVLDSGWFILGAELEAFEAEFARYCGTRHCIGVGNGLEAISLLLRAHGVGAGDEVIVPAHTFIATWLGVTEVGATPVPVAVNETTGNLDAERIDAAITPRTRAILPVHLYGQPADMDAIGEVASSRDLLVLEDAAQAHGARWRGRRVGGLGAGAAFSFYPGKNLGGFGDAGAITCDDDAIAQRCRLLRNYGSSRKYVHDVAGVNSRLDELQAAVLRVRLDVLDSWNARRATVAGRYRDELSGVTPLALADGAESVWHLFVVRSPARDDLRRRLREAGVETLVHYPSAPHETGAYADLRVTGEQVRSATALSRTVLSLPIGPHMDDDAVERVIQAVTAAARVGS